jgi:dihydrofolate synthase/folylpolyglutamate synthase
VAERLHLLAAQVPIITVAGTNGKGSTCAMLTTALHLQGYQVGTYTSPHILHYNERIAINAQPVADEFICQAFMAIDAARGDISLTYFEFGTLAAVWCFLQAQVDIMVLEVGLGGRLDAVNLWEADVGIITSIGIDHVEWLGSTREAIGYEKAGIMRPHKPIICGDPEPPDSIAAQAQQIGALLYQYGRDFDASDLPVPSLLGEHQLQNAACVRAALWQLATRLPITDAIIKQGIQQTQVLGRLQRLQTQPDLYIDVAHNPHAVQELANWLKKEPIDGKLFVIFSILADKDSTGVIDIMRPLVDEWALVQLSSSRAVDIGVLKTQMLTQGVTAPIQLYSNFQSAWDNVKQAANTNDRIIAFGSFLVVTGMLTTLEH